MGIKDLLPIIIIQGILQISAISHLIYKKKTENLNVWAWAGIILVTGVIGSILYFSMGRSDE